MLQLVYSVSSHRDLARGLEAPRELCKGPDDGTALSTQRQPRGKPTSLDQCDPVGPLGSWLPRLGPGSGVDKGGAGGRIAIHESFAKTQGTGGGDAQMQSDGGPSAIDSFAIRRRTGPEADSGSA